jgi:hypothetical protein
MGPGRKGEVAALLTMPIPVEGAQASTTLMGITMQKQHGATSYLIVRPEGHGNILMDGLRFN